MGKMNRLKLILIKIICFESIMEKLIDQERWIMSVKILLVPPKCEIIIVPSNYSFMVSVLWFISWLLYLKLSPFQLYFQAHRGDIEKIYKINKKIEAKRLRATTFAIAKFEEQWLNGEQ